MLTLDHIALTSATLQEGVDLVGFGLGGMTNMNS